MENGKVVGFDADLGTEIARELGVKAEFQGMEWAGVFAAVETGKADLVMSGVTITAERLKGNAFTRPYFLSGQVIVLPKGKPAVLPEALAKVDGFVAVQQETTGQFAMEKRGMSKEKLHRFDTLQDALLDVRNGKSVAAVGDLPALRDIIAKGYPELIIPEPTPFVRENLGIVARTDARDLVAAMNAALDRIIADGRYARIYKKWTHEPVTTELIAGLYNERNAGTRIPADIIAQVSKPQAGANAAATPNVITPLGGSALSIRPDVLRQALPALLLGARLTIVLTLSTLVLGVPLGLGLALLRGSRLAPLRALAVFYVEVVRGTPLLMQIYVIYFVFPAIGLSLNPFVAGLAALSFNSAAYCAEIFRAGIESIEKGQTEAARALGMTPGLAMRYIVLPQTLRRVLPPLTNEAVALLKDSSLVSVVALSELMRVGKEVATTAGAPTTVYLAVALLYLVLTLPLTYFARRLESRLGFVSRPRPATTANNAI